LIHTHGRSIQAELSRKYLIPAEKITWIPNIIFNKTQLDSLLQISLQKKIKTTGYIFLFIGLDGKNKGLLDAVQSFIGASTKNHQLIIVTDTSSDYYNRQVKPIISIRKNITIMNKMPPENVYILFSESDVFLFPSYSEGTPNVVAEAMAAGCYIISYKIPGLDDLLIHNRNGRLVEKKDKLSLTNEIDMFVSGKMNHDCEKYREYNHRFMVENYDSDKISGDYINMYKGCIRE
jgi:glycosyltransferase involved in cell wall biosynthesis